jgi:HK97 family phage portal protein
MEDFVVRVTSLTKPIERKSDNIAVIQRNVTEFQPTFPGDIQALLKDQSNPSFQKFLLFWTMMDTIEVHGYSRAAMSAIGRSTIGAWWKLSKHEEWGSSGTERQRRRLYRFYTHQEREWDNIKDFYSLAYKLVIGAMYLRYFGQVAYEVTRNNAGKIIGFDHLTGITVPNTDDRGYFKVPAFVQYPTRDPRINTEFDSPRDIVYIINPDWKGSPLGGSDIEALTEYTLPLDIYLQTAAREYMKNSARPELIFMLPQDISDDAFNAFVAQMEAKYRGASNVGKNPIAVAGELGVKRVDELPQNLPYQDSRKDTREEVLAVSGTGGALLGISDSLSSANIRETRRQFHETTMEPLFKILEQGFYEQIHVREFNAEGWTFVFNNPDFLTAVERATVHMRNIENGIMNPNEAREELGRDPREGGDFFVEVASDPKDDEEQGSPPEGREEEPDDPSNTGEPTDDDQDPERGDQHDEEPKQFLTVLSADDPALKEWAGPVIEAEDWEEAEELLATFEATIIGQMIEDVMAWRKFALKRFKRGRKLREFRTEHIPTEAVFIVQASLEEAHDVEEIKYIFNDLLENIKELYNGEDK